MIEKNNDAEADSVDPLSTINYDISDLGTGIPAPIFKNAMKAFGRLCSTAVEYPISMIEGAIAEKRAETRARVKLLDASAAQIAEQMRTDPEFARAAATKFAQKIVRERVNIDQVSLIAAADLKSEPHTHANESTPEVPSISDDWLNVFETEAAQMSSEKMQRLFGKILAGEIRRPSSYSIKTVKLMAQLDNCAAELFALACSLSISMRDPKSNAIIDARVVSMGNAASNSLRAFGLGFAELNILHEYGLVISDYNSYMDYQFAVVHEATIGALMIHQSREWVFVPKVALPNRREFRVHGVGLSRCGIELLPIVDIMPNADYTAALTNFFDQQGMTMTHIETKD